jgi:uracil-DNA glycosylase
MAKLIDLPIEQLYDRAVTPKMIEAIQLKDSFEDILPRYCSKICSIPEEEKDPASVDLDLEENLDILVVSTCPPAGDKFRTGLEIAKQHKDVFTYLFTSLRVPPTKWDYTFLSKCPLKAGKRRVPAARRCVPYLRAQIRRSTPKVIVATSADVRAALGVVSSGRSRGAIHFYRDGDRDIPVVSTVHPALLSMIRQNSSGDMWGSEYYSIIRGDLEKARCITRTGPGLVAAGPTEAVREAIARGDIFITRSLDEVARECGKILASIKLVSWDIESTGTDPWAPDAKVLCMQFGYRENSTVKAVVIPLWHRENRMYSPDEAWGFVRSILEAPDIIKVGHHMKFDLLYTSVVTGVRPVAAELDTMLLLHAINSGVQGNYSLKTAVWDYLWDTGFGGYENDLGEEDDVEETEGASDDQAG